MGRTHVAGISLGGLIAQAFAASWPELVDRLILIDTTPRYTDELRTMWDARAATARSAGVATMVDDLLKIWFSADALARDQQGVRYVRATLARCSGEGYALACEALKTADLRPLAPNITAPTLVVCGDDDIPSFLDAARWLAPSIPNAELAWMAGAKHASVLEKPAKARGADTEFPRHVSAQNTGRPARVFMPTDSMDATSGGTAIARGGAFCHEWTVAAWAVMTWESRCSGKPNQAQTARCLRKKSTVSVSARSASGLE